MAMGNVMMANQRRADVPEKNQTYEGDHNTLLNKLFAQRGNGTLDQLATVIGRDNFDAFGQ